MATITEASNPAHRFNVTFAKLPPDVLAVGKPTANGLEIVLDQQTARMR
jgi:hypothetical protein